MFMQAPQNVESTEGPAYYAEHAYIPGELLL